jgi:hypothetical protein
MNFTKYALIALTLTNTAFAKCPNAIDLKKFHDNPEEFLNENIVKYNKKCRPVRFTLFGAEQLKNKKYVELKDEARKEICNTSEDGTKKVCLSDILPGADVLSGRAPIESVDNASNLVSGRVIDNIFEMSDMDLEEGKVASQPWSDWYWPIAVGQLSYRYNDSRMMNEYYNSDPSEETMWTWFNEYHATNPAMPENINELSPAEKYDLLVGDTNYSLTKTQLAAGKYYQDNYGKVEGWMGLCHGWAPASYMLERPVKSIKVTASDKLTEIEFLPTDIKALGTLLWATGNQNTKFIGGRCNAKDPETDDNGRVIDQECFDNNPGTWHKTVVSQLGLHQKTFVMDATFDYEVWNHPVTSYEYTYFNPKTMEEFDSIDDALISMSEFSNDKFADYRSEKTKFVVGVVMEVEYLVETMPNTAHVDEEDNDAFHYATYTYDLELDGRGNIIGGEWYTNKHPDFLWTPYDNSHATSVVDSYIEMDEFPLSLLSHPALPSLVPYASNKGQPIGKIVEALFREASN